MQKSENIADVQQIKAARFIKLYGHAPVMEQPASEAALNSYKASHLRPFHVFTVPREYPVCDFQTIPQLLLDETFSFTAQPGEFFVFQLVIWAPEQALGNLQVSASDGPLPWRCFNLNAGQRLNLPSHAVQPLWMGIEIPQEAQPSYQLNFQIHATNCPSETVEIPLTVTGNYLPDGGEDDGERLARLRWLDSDIGKEDSVFPPYLPISRQGKTLKWLGHTLELENNGLPRHITTSYANGRISACATPLLRDSISFSNEQGECLSGTLEFTTETQTQISWKATGKIGAIPAILTGSLEFDGTLKYRLLVLPQQDDTQSFTLSIQHREATHFCGLNRHGGTCPDNLQWYWNPDTWQDGYWIGSQDGGMLLKLCDANTNSPLINAYYHFYPLHLPDAWNNQGQGGIFLHKEGTDIISSQCFSGKTKLLANHPLDFSFELHITPFHETEMKRFFNEHFYHPCMHSFVLGDPDPLENANLAKLKRDGITCLNIHHAVGMNPIINYPFTTEALQRLKSFTDKAHQQDLKVILYYTTRELTVHCPEFWAFRSLGAEIFFPGPGSESRPCTNPNGPHEWLCKKLKRNFLPAWAEVIKNGEFCHQTDVALETTPQSRLENFYLEGLRFLLERIPLDGLYLDDSDLSPEGFQRLWRIFRDHGCKHPIIDFHAWNPFSFKRQTNFGNNSVICRDIDKLPYVTDLWLGEGVDYEAASWEYYMTEISGLPFGLTGEMLSGGGNPWRGLVFGMTNRFGWGGDPRAIWNCFKDFGTTGLRLDFPTEAPLRLGEGLAMSRYSNDSGKIGYAVASWHPTDTVITAHSNLRQPAISGFQEARNIRQGEVITVRPGRGVFLISE